MTPAERQAWLAKRRQGIGASDIGKIAGLLPPSFGGPLDVYLDKVGLLPERDSPAMWLGRIFEDAIAKAYEHVTGKRVWGLDFPDNMVVHPSIQWVFSTPDRIVDHEPIWVECKRSDDKREWGTPGTDQVPWGYFAQCQWQLLAGKPLHQVERIDLAVILPGNDFRVYEIPPCEPIQDILLDLARDMMGRVARREPPPLDFRHPRTVELLDLLWKPEPKKRVSLLNAHDILADEYKRLGEVISELEKARDLYRAGLVMGLEDNEEGLCPSGRLITRKTTKNGQVRLTVPTRPEGEGE